MDRKVVGEPVMENMQIARRMGLSPAQHCVTDANCPDVFRLTDRRFAVIGTDATEELRGSLPADAAVQRR